MTLNISLVPRSFSQANILRKVNNCLTKYFMVNSSPTLPRVSIIVPVYDVAPYLRAAIDSILSQTFADYELLLINDGSTDGSAEILEEYRRRDTRIVTLHKENEGVARTLNRGLAMARGEYIRRFDADDTCLPTALENQVVFLDSHPEIAMVSTQQAFQTTRGKIARNHRTPNSRYFDNQPYRIVEPREIYDLVPIVHGTVLLRRKVLDQIGYYRPEFLTSEDQDLWFRISERYKIAIMNECTYFLRLHSGSATARHRQTIRFYLDLTLKFHEERLKTGSDPLQRGEPMPSPPAYLNEVVTRSTIFSDGWTVHPHLNFMYRLLIDAGDWLNAFRLACAGLRSGWRRGATYKLLAFPILGDRLVQVGVKIKALLRGKAIS